MNNERLPEVPVVRGCIPGSPGESGLVSRGSQGLRKAVGHELKITVGRDKGDGAVIVKAREPHALVEFHILQFHRLVLAP